MIGRVLSHYEITGKLGAGGMGEVYLARDLSLDRLVALKVLPPEMSADAERLRRLQREAKALAALDHPNIVTVFSVEEADGVRFLTMAYVDGRTLKEAIPPEGLPLERLLEYALALADALRAAHERGIVHRDLKPGNVMVDGEDRLRILDFGLAKVQPVTAAADTSEFATQTMTRQGTILGTVPYMSPEQVEGKPVDERSDLFSLGVMLYEMATATRPFEGDTPASLISSILRDTPEPVSRVHAGLPGRLDAILQRCLEKDPGKRYRSAAHLREDLRALQSAAASGSGVGVSPLRPAGPKGVRSRAGMALGLLAAVIVIAVVGWKLRPGTAPEPTRGVGEDPFSIAVLPMSNLSQDGDQEYFVEGMTAALTADLSRIHALKVIAPSSTRRLQGDRDAIVNLAAKLEVEAVLDGSVLRDDDRVAVTVHLVRAQTGEILWAQRYERDVTSVLALHGEISRTIAQEIEVRLTPEEEEQLSAPREVDRKTFEAYLRGMHHLNKGTSEGVVTGIRYLNEAIEHDAADARAYAGLALGYARIGHDIGPSEVMFPRAVAAARTALRLDPSLAEAHAAIADVKLYYEWDFPGAKEAFEQTVRLNPSLADAWANYAWYYAVYGEWAEAIRVARRGQELDPLSPAYTVWVGCLQWYRGDHDEAIVEARKSLELNPDYAFGWYVLGSVFAEQGRIEEAIEAHRQAVASNPGFGWVLAGTLGRAGRADEARRALDDWPGRDVPAASLNAAMALVLMGETDEALDKLEEAYEHRHQWMPWIDVLPELRGLQEEPRFREMLRKMRLLDDEPPDGGRRRASLGLDFGPAWIREQVQRA